MAGATLLIKIIADATKAQQTMGQAATGAQKFSAGLSKAVLPAAAITAGLGVMAKNAADDARAQAQLAQSLRQAAGATADQIAQTEDFISKTTLATGVTDDQLRPALATLARSTKDVGEAQKGMSLALDISAATGKDVETVSLALAKAYGGNTSALSRMIPGLDKGIMASKDMNKISAELSRTMGGAAAVQANTAAGKFQRMQTAIDETKESIGAALLPAMTSLVGVLTNAATWTANNAGAMHVLVIVVGALAAAILAAKIGMIAYNVVTGIQAGLTATSTASIETNTIAMVAYGVQAAIVRTATLLWAGAMAVLSAVMDANPIVLIVLAVLALVAAIVIAYKRSQTFRNIVQATWNAIKVAALFVWNNVLKPVFSFIIAYYRLLWQAAQVATRFIIAAWNAVKTALVSAYRWVKTNVIDPYIAAFKLVYHWAEVARDRIRNAWNAIKQAISNAWASIRSIFDSIISKVRSVIEWFGKIKLPSAVTSALGALGIGGRSAPAPPVPLGPRVVAVPTVGRGRAGATSTTRAGLAQLPAIVVQVYLDGKQVGGYVDRVITTRLNDEGARLASGAWA